MFHIDDQAQVKKGFRFSLQTKKIQNTLSHHGPSVSPVWVLVTSYLATVAGEGEKEPMMFCLYVPLRDLTGFNFCTVQVRATRLRDLYAKVGCSYIPRLQGLDTRGGGPHFPLVYMEKPRPRETAQPLSPTPGQHQTSPELHCTKILLLCSSRNSTNSLRFKNFLSNKYILYFP